MSEESNKSLNNQIAIGDNLYRRTDIAKKKYKAIVYLRHNFLVDFIRRIKKIVFKKNTIKKNLSSEQTSIISQFLENGYYVIGHNNIKKVKKKKKTIIINSLEKVGSLNSSAKYYSGEWTDKDVFIFDKIVLSFYPGQHLKWIENIKKYIDKLNYPKCDFYEINSEKLFTVCGFSKGAISYDPEKILKVCFDILILNEQAEKVNYLIYKESAIKKLRANNIEDDFVLGYVQHGDVAVCNILWENKNSYHMIDFDLIEIYPALYDFFSLLLYESIGVFGLVYFINGFFDSEINNVLKLSEKELTIQKDKYLAIFLSLRSYILDQNKRLLRKLLPKSYSKCWGLL